MRKEMTPNITMLGIGATKAGTSWLHKQLNKHPEIWMPPVKELHFFDRSINYPSPNTLATSSPISRMFGSQPWEGEQMIKHTKNVLKHIKAGGFTDAIWWSKWTFGYYSDSWYKSLFLEGLSYQVRGEITPAYSILEREDVARIKEINPDIKLIYLIRNPIDRAWSNIRHNFKKGYLNIDLSEAEMIAALQRKGTVIRGDYERTLETYLRYFDSSQILVCFYDAIQANPSDLMLGITNFLDISAFKEGIVDSQALINASPLKEMPSRVKDYLAETYTPMIKRLANKFGSYARVWEQSLSNSDLKTLRIDSNLDYTTTFHP